MTQDMSESVEAAGVVRLSDGFDQWAWVREMKDELVHPAAVIEELLEENRTLLSTIQELSRENERLENELKVQTLANAAHRVESIVADLQARNAELQEVLLTSNADRDEARMRAASLKARAEAAEEERDDALALMHEVNTQALTQGDPQ